MPVRARHDPAEPASLLVFQECHAEVWIFADRPVSAEMEVGTTDFHHDPTEDPFDNYSTVSITATAPEPVR